VSGRIQHDKVSSPQTTSQFLHFLSTMKRSHPEGGSGKPVKRIAADVNKKSRASIARLADTPVPPHVRRAGDYLIGPKLGASPVKSISHCLGRKDGTDKYYMLKILSLVLNAKESQDERQGKMLLHTEHSLLSLLQGVRGVVQSHHTFMDTVLQEEDGRYTGKRVRRVVLVLDCLAPHDFSSHTRDLINLQHHVIREKKLTEKETLVIFHAVIDIVCKLHKASIVHRDLKLGNIVLDKRSHKVTITNFCLGKHLMSDSDLLKDQRGSPAYISPDVLSGKPYHGKPSDMWALGVVLFTMLYGQFPFYDSAPQELFNKIKTADFSIPEDGRVSEDTKTVIRRLLVTDPSERLTAEQVKVAVEGIIVMWRNISPGSEKSSTLQVVPEWKGNTIEKKSEKEKRELSHENVLRNLAHGRETVVAGGRKVGEVRERGRGGIPVHRLGEDARPLTAEEYRMYSPVINEMRGGRRDRRGVASTSPAQVLVRGERMVMSGRSGQPVPPVPALVSLPATVPDQAEVLDLSAGPRRETPPVLPPPRPVPSPYAGHSSSVNLTPCPAPAHSRPRSEDSALTLVGALRRLGTRVNLVPVNFSVDRTRSHSPVRSSSPGNNRETMVTVARASSEDRRGDRSSGWQVRNHRDRERSHRDRDRTSSRSQGDRNTSSRSRDRTSSRIHGDGSSGSRSSTDRSSRPHRDRHAVIERISEFHRVNRPPSPSLPRQSDLGLTYVSRLSPTVALPLADATRLLNSQTMSNSTWEPESVREADIFMRDLASTSTARSHSTSWDRNGNFSQMERPHTVTTDYTETENQSQANNNDMLNTERFGQGSNSADHSIPVASTSDYYNPAVPTEDTGPTVPNIS